MQKLLISFCFFDSQKLIIYLCISNVFLASTNTVMPAVLPPSLINTTSPCCCLKHETGHDDTTKTRWARGWRAVTTRVGMGPMAARPQKWYVFSHIFYTNDPPSCSSHFDQPLLLAMQDGGGVTHFLLTSWAFLANPPLVFQVREGFLRHPSFLHLQWGRGGGAESPPSLEM